MEFRRVLSDIGHTICDEELNKLKFLCTNEFGKRTLEQITSPLELWTKLEEKCLINPNNILYLKTLCKDGLQDRQDILEVLENYEKSSNNQSISEDLTRELEIICEKLPVRNWKMFVRRLGLCDKDIDEIVQVVPQNAREQFWRMLRLCVAKRPITKQDLIAALRACGCNLTADLVDSVR